MSQLVTRRFAGVALLVVVCVAACPVRVEATERGLAAYPDGAQNFLCGVFPPPGFYFQNTVLYYSADDFKGAVEGIPADFNGFANVFNYVYSSDTRLWGANWGYRISFPLTYFSIRGKRQPIGFNDFGVGNSSFAPFVLGYHFGDYHLTPAFTIIFPGAWDASNYASPSQNYYSFQPGLGVAWMPKSRIGVNAFFMYDFPTKNTDPLPPAVSSYQSGQAFHFDYCVDYAFRPNLRAGLAGFYYFQTTSDFRDGQDIGFRGRQFAIGPAVKYDRGKFSVSYIANFESATQFRPDGVRNWVNVVYAF